VAFIKIDAQGSEMDVLQGAPRVLAGRHIAWQIEIDPATLAHRGQPVAKLAELLASLNEPGAGRTDVLFFSMHPDE
jgi:hypothetical protein